MADLFGKQTFLNADKSENTVFYKFPDKATFDAWKGSDITCYQADYAKNLTRQKASEKQFDAHIAKEGRFKDFTGKDKFVYKKVDPKACYVHLKHSNEKYDKDFGIVIKFDNEKSKDDFIKNKGGDYYAANMKDLKPTDPRVLAANSNGMFLIVSDKMNNPTEKINNALKNYHHLNPANKHLVYLAQKDNSKPEILSFDSRRDRATFMSRSINNIKNKKLPITMSAGKNFNAIVVDHAAKGKILEGDLTKHFGHVREYLQFHNKKDFAAPSQEKLDTKQFQTLIENLKETDKPLVIERKDLRNVDFSKVKDLSGASIAYSNLKGSDLSGVDFSKTDLKKVDLSDTNLSGAKFDGSKLDHVNFKSSHAKDNPASFSKVNDMGSDFKYSNMPGSDFSDAKMARSNFYMSTLKDANLSGGNFKGIDFNKANLSNASISQNLKTLDGSSFKGANVKGTSIEGSKLEVKAPAKSASQSM